MELAGEPDSSTNVDTLKIAGPVTAALLWERCMNKKRKHGSIPVPWTVLGVPSPRAQRQQPGREANPWERFSAKRLEAGLLRCRARSRSFAWSIQDPKIARALAKMLARSEKHVACQTSTEVNLEDQNCRVGRKGRRLGCGALPSSC